MTINESIAKMKNLAREAEVAAAEAARVSAYPTDVGLVKRHAVNRLEHARDAIEAALAALNDA